MEPLSVEDLIRMHEGCSDKVYLDTEGIPTVGVGFNLNRHDARQVLAMVGADYNEIRAGEHYLTENQIDGIFQYCLYEAIFVASEIIPWWPFLSVRRKNAFVDMVFNLGGPKLRQFKKMMSALRDRNYDLAADEAMDSKWYRQVKSRGPRIVEMIRQG